MLKNIILLILILQSIEVKSNIVITNGLTHQHKTEKGQVYKGKIEIQNVGKTVKNVKLYLQDVDYNSEGTTFYTEPGTNRLSNSAWIKLNTNLIEIKAGEKSEVYYEVNIPNHVTIPGTYWSTCMIEPVEDIIPSDNSNAGIQVRSVVRYAIQIISDYSTQSISPELKFIGLNIDNIDQRKTLKIALANDGEVFCKTIVSIEIYDLSEMMKIEGEFNSQKMGLLPHTSKSFLINISALQPGKYKAIAFAKDELENIFALEFQLDVP